MESFTYQVLFVALLFGLPSMALTSCLPPEKPFFARLWIGFLGMIVLSVAAFLIVGFSGNMATGAEWLH